MALFKGGRLQMAGRALEPLPSAHPGAETSPDFASQPHKTGSGRAGEGCVTRRGAACQLCSHGMGIASVCRITPGRVQMNLDPVTAALLLRCLTERKEEESLPLSLQALLFYRQKSLSAKCQAVASCPLACPEQHWLGRACNCCSRQLLP